MAHLRRLMWFALGFLIAAVPMLAAAEEKNLWEATLYGGHTVYASTANQACGFIKPRSTASGNFCRDSDGTAWGTVYYRLASCAGTWTESSSTPGYWYCQASPQAQCEQSGGYWGGNNTVGGLFEPTESCYAATPICMESGGVVASVYNLDGRCGVYQAACPADYGDPVSPGNLGGGQCLYGGTPPDPDPDPEPDPDKPDQTPSGCGAGQDSGTVNGVPVCINRPPSNSSDTKTETKTNPDGSTTETTKTTNTTVNNTTNTTTTTTTTTVVHKDSTGAVTGTETTTETQEQSTDGYCEANPDSTVCGGGEGGWQGGCDDPGRVVHECKGDPIQCAIAEQTLRTRCALAASDAVVEAFEEMVTFDGTGEGEGLDRREIQVPETLDVNEIGGGAGLTDKTFVIMGKSIEVPFSLINSYLDIFGAAVMMIAWIVAFNTIRGAI